MSLPAFPILEAVVRTFPRSVAWSLVCPCDPTDISSPGPSLRNRSAHKLLPELSEIGPLCLSSVGLFFCPFDFSEH